MTRSGTVGVSLLLAVACGLWATRGHPAERPLWLTGKGLEPPRLYLFVQGYDPHEQAMGRLIRALRPDLYQWGAGPHYASRPAPGPARSSGWSYQPGEVKIEKPTGRTYYTAEEYAALADKRRREARYITEESWR